MKKLIKPISIVLVIVQLLLISVSAFAATGTIASASDNALLSKWKGYGLLDNSIATSELYKPIQKIDFIMYINSVLKSSKQADIGFSDVPKSSWYGDEIAKAVASGYVSNEDKTNFNPFSNISRIDAAVMAAHVFGLELSDEKVLNKITDAEKLSAEQLADFGAVIEKGYLAEISKGRYAPSGVLKLIDAIKMLDKCIGQLVTKAGTITSDASGNMMISASSVILKDMEIAGDLIIGEGVAEGTVRIENVLIKGKLIIRGGGPNSVTLKNTKVTGNLVVEKYAGNVNVVALGTTTIEQTYLKSGGTLAETSLTTGKGFVNVTVAQAVVENQTANLKGDFNNIKVEESNVDVKLSGNAENINITKNSDGSFALISGNAKTISTQASKNIIDVLGGTVTTLNVDTGAKGNKITINGATTISAITVKENTTFNILKGTVDKLTLESTSQGSYVSMMTGGYIKNIVANAAATVTGYGKIDNAYVYANNVSMDIRPGGVYVASGIIANINGTSIDPTLSNMTITASDKILQEGETKSAGLSGYPYGSTLAYISSDNTIATVSDKGEIKGISAGTTTIYATVQCPSYNTSVAAIKVNVTSGNVTAIGTLTISPDSWETGTNKDFEITYTAKDNISNGTVVIKLPAGFSVYETDTVKIGNGTEKVLYASQRPNIQMLSFTNLNLEKNVGTIVVKMKNRLVPPGGQYVFTADSDADGTGPRLPTSWQEKGIFTSSSLNVLLEGENANYKKPEPGTEGGTTKISRLSFVGLAGASSTTWKWLVKVQSGAFTAPNYEEDLSEEGFTEYKQSENISVVADQHMMLVAVDASSKVKAYKEIVFTGDASGHSNMIRLYDANQLTLAANSLASGIQAGAVRINNLDLINVTGASIWMVKVQDNSASNVFVDTKFDGVQYTSGEDIKVYATQHIILAATTSDSSIKAYADIKIDDAMISKPAENLVLGNNYNIPTSGTSEGAIQIEELNKGSFAVDNWMVVLLSEAAVTPAMDVLVSDYEKYYTESTVVKHNTFKPYLAKSDIAMVAGKRLLLVGVDSAGQIKAYVDLVIDPAIIRKADVPQIPDINFAAPSIGATAGTTRFTDLNFNKSTTGTSISVDAKKYMYKVQDGDFATPQINSIQSGAKDCVVNGKYVDIPVTSGQHLILVATDANGWIKAYKIIVVDLSQIRPADAYALKPSNDYSLVPGSVDGSTKIVLASNVGDGWVPGIFKWMYKVQNTSFETPYKGSIIAADMKVFTSGVVITDSAIAVDQYILIVAVDNSTDGKTLAYAQEKIKSTQIKQPAASILKSSSEVTGNENYNYSVPEPGQVGGTTRIASLNTMGIQGATKWLYKISATSVTTPEYNSVVSGLFPYYESVSIDVTAGQYFVLYAVDNYSKVKAFKNIPIDQSQIRTPAAELLVSPTNFTAPSYGSTPGSIVISALAFGKLGGSDWKYAVGDTKFNAPEQNSSVSAIGFTTDVLTTTTNISVRDGQWILLLSIDASGAVKGYANINVKQIDIRPYNADPISTTSYSLTKGASEGSTRFDKLSLLGIYADRWMIKTQKGVFEAPAKDMTVTGSTVYNHNLNPMSDIKAEVDSHILLLATDMLGRVKAYADITVTGASIQVPFAMNLTETTNYIGPEQGTSPGAIMLTLNDFGIKKASGETVEWKYKISTEAIKIPHLDEAASGSEYQEYESNGDIQVAAGNILLVVGVIGDKIKAYRQFTIDPLWIKPANASELVLNYNYSAPLPGSAPGTTKITNLSLIGIQGAAYYKWQFKVVNTAEILTLNSIFTYPIAYSSGADIAVKMNQYVVLAVVDDSGKVKAYKNIQITLDSQLNPPLAEKLKPGTNYSAPKFGSVTGTTSIYVSPQGLNGCIGFVAQVVDAPVNIIEGSTISYTTASAIDFAAFRSYTSGNDILASIGQYVLLVAVDKDNKVLAYENIDVIDSSVRPGDAISLKTPENYSALQTGTGVGTTKFINLDFVGVPGGENWIVKVQDTSPSAILMNSYVEGAVVYAVNQDIPVREGQYVVLYAMDTTGRIKGYVGIKVGAENVRGVAPLLKLGTEYSIPVPGAMINTTKFEATTLKLPAGATIWKYAIQNSAAGTILKDSLLTGFTSYTEGSDILAAEGQHLILVATDALGYTKAYADIVISASNLRNVEATLSGTIISIPTGEANIVSGGRTIVIKLAYGEWQDDVLTNTTKRNSLFDGLVASGDESSQWGKVIAILKIEGMSAAVMKATKDEITITLSETTAYDITKPQEISLTIKPELIKNAVKSAIAINKINISANVVVQLDGTVITVGVAEGDIVAGSKTIIIKLTNGEFALDVASKLEKRNAIFEGFKASYDTSEWNKVIDALKTAGETAITRNASNKITIELPSVYGIGVAGGYNITRNETINLIVPYQTTSGEAILVGAIKEVAALTQLTITANAAADLSGTLFSSAISETNIVNGGKTLVITLTDGQWVTDIATDTTKRNALFAGLIASTEASEWTKVITALQTAGEYAITRTSNSAITINLPAVTGYNIASNQNVGINIPASSIIGSKATLIAAQTIKIERMPTATLSGTAIGSSIGESDIMLGGKTIIITLNNATWVDNVATNITIRDALLDGFVADVENTQWSKVVSALKSGLGSVTKTAANIITITLPTVVGYDLIAAKQNITVTIPTSAAIGTSFDILATNLLLINSTAPVAAKVVEVSGPTGLFKLGEVITISVKFDTAVDVVGTPILNLETGSVDRDALYTTISAIGVLTFEYTVQSGDTSQKLDYKATSSLVIPAGAAIYNKGTSVKAIITLPSPGSTTSLSYANILVDAIVPKFVTLYPKLGTKTETTANILVKVDKAAKIYYVTIPKDSSNVTPTVNQIIAGQDAAGVTVAAIMIGMLDTVENVELTLPISGLSALTAYTTYIVAVDSLNNASAVTAFGFTTADTTPPEFITGYPMQKTPTSYNKIDIAIRTNEAGTIYLIALPSGSQAPTSAQVISGIAVAENLKATAAITTNAGITTDTDGNTTYSGITLGVTGLTVSTVYDIYVVCVDTAGNISSPVSISATTSQLKLDSVGVDLTKKQITNTTVQMEYSFDEVFWSPCAATNTNITYDDDAQMLVIYIREARNVVNKKQLPVLIRGDESAINKSQIAYDIAAKKITNASTINLQYRINGAAWGTLNASSSASNIDFVPGLLEVRTAATQTTLPSISVLVDTIAVAMTAPELEFNDDENVIDGLESKYEYRIVGVVVGAWKTGVVEGEFAGTKKVEVREKATKDRLPSSIQTIEFTAGVIEVVASPSVSGKKVVTITFEENTNKKALTVQNIIDCFIVGTLSTTSGVIETPHKWGADFTSSWNTTGNSITIVYNTMTGASIQIKDVVMITTAAGIKNAAPGTSDYYTSKGVLTGSFHTVPAIVSIKAVNVTNSSISFDDGDSIVITFDQPTKATTLSAIISNDNYIGKFLEATDSAGIAKTTAWAAVTTNSSIVWNTSGTALTITFDNATATTSSSLSITDKITISPLLGLTDADETTEACNSSSFISGSFAAAPKILKAVIANVGASGTRNVGDTITITFDQATNKKQITASQLIKYFKLLVPPNFTTTHSWGVQADSDITWNTAGTVLTIKLSTTAAVTLAFDDTLVLDALAGIKDVDNNLQVSGSIGITGAY